MADTKIGTLDRKSVIRFTEFLTIFTECTPFFLI